MNNIDNYNRELVIERYVTSLVGSLNFIETKEMLKDLLIEKKSLIDDHSLEREILDHDPFLLTDLYIEEILQEATSCHAYSIE